MSDRYFESLPGGFDLNIVDGSWWIEPDADLSGEFSVYAISGDGIHWDIVTVQHRYFSDFEQVVDHVTDLSDDLRDVVDELEIWQGLTLDRGYMHGIAASREAELLSGGNCYQVAFDNMMDSIDDTSTMEPSLYVCHGICVYDGDTEFTHAWNETLDGEYCIDTSNGNDLFMPTWRYYELFDVEEDSVHRYKYWDGYAEMERAMKWGPWADELQFVERSMTAGISDEFGGGDCFVVALENMMRDRDLYLCHGIVTGQGPLEGVRYSHAWNETQSGFVIDQSNGNDIVIDKASYYALGRIDPSEVRYYNYEEMLRNVVERGTYGPWDDDLFGGVL